MRMKIFLAITVIVTAVAFVCAFEHKPLLEVTVTDVKHDVFHSIVTTMLDSETLSESVFRTDSVLVREEMRCKYKSLQQVDENEFQLEIIVTKNKKLQVGETYYLYVENDVKDNTQVYRLSEKPDFAYGAGQIISWLFMMISVFLVVLIILAKKGIVALG